MVALPTMESLGLLKYWRGGAAAIRTSVAVTVDFATAVLRPSSATAVDEEEDDDAEGPFFDLEFTALPVGDVSALVSDREVDEGQFTVELSSAGGSGVAEEGRGGSGLRTQSFCPIAASESDTKHYFPVVSLLKSATKFRVFLLGLRKPRPPASEPNASAVATASSKRQQSRFFVKLKVEEVPIVSLFTRDNSFRNISGGSAAKLQSDDGVSAAAAAATPAQQKTLVSREIVQKYVNMIKPVYIRVSRRPFEKVRLTGEPPAASREEGGRGAGKGLPAGLKAVGKRLGKSRSASVPPQRPDESVVRELDDVIQSAIAHCKRSFTVHEKGSESPPLLRRASEPSSGDTGDRS